MSKKVFIAGSRSITKLHHDITMRIDNILAHGFTILLGDATGADKAVQKYLFEKQYENVIIFCSGNYCRNNLGNWETHFVEAVGKKNGFEFYTAKDIEMARQSDYGLMIWDSKSKGTMNNIMNLIRYEKGIILYFTPNKNFYAIRNIDDLLWILNQCDKEHLDEFESSLNLTQFIENNRQLSISL